MKRTLLPALAATALAAGIAHADNAMYSCTDARGTAQLTNVPTSDQCEKLFNYQAPAPEAKAPVAAAPAPRSAAPVAQASAQAAAPADASATPADPDREPSAAPPAVPGTLERMAATQRLSDRRTAVQQQTANAYASGQPASVANRAVNRRYLATSRAEYVTANGTHP